MPRLPALLAIAVLPLCAAAQGDPVVGLPDGNAKMNAAIAEAQATLPLLHAHGTDADGFGLRDAMVEVAILDQFGGDEIIWIGPFFGDGVRAMIGLPANAPVAFGDLRLGDQVSVTTDMVRDWSLTGSEGRIWSKYTTRVMLPRLDGHSRALLQQRLSPTPVPVTWQAR